MHTGVEFELIEDIVLFTNTGTDYPFYWGPGPLRPFGGDSVDIGSGETHDFGLISSGWEVIVMNDSTYVNPADFITSGGIIFDYVGVFETYSTSNNNQLFMDYDTRAWGGIRLTYNYTEIPEPGSLALLALALPLLTCIRRS